MGPGYRADLEEVGKKIGRSKNVSLNFSMGDAETFVTASLIAND
jgi:hypothetical protein